MFMNKQLLYSIGLSKTEATIYELLLEDGPDFVTNLAQKSGMTRQYLYDILEHLSIMKLIEKTDSKRLRYTVRNPKRILEIAQEQEKKKSTNVLMVESNIADLISEYNISTNKPHVVILEGYKGVERLHKDIEKTKQIDYLFRSFFDNKSKEMIKLVEQHIKKRSKLGVGTYALTPVADWAVYNYFKEDRKRRVQRRFVNTDLFTLNSQINIYGNKIAIMSLRKKIVITLIENEDIAQTFKTLFKFIWSATEEYHKSVIEKYRGTELSLKPPK